MESVPDLDRAPAPPQPRWQGELTLGFDARGGGTALVDRRHRGPLQVQRAFHPEGPAVCHVYLLHPPGGLVAGDELEVQVTVAPGAHALLTTPASTKVYRSGQGQLARQRQRLQVAAGGRLEWLPQDTIVFEGAEVELGTRVELAGDAAFAGWELVSLGRPAAADHFARGRCRQRFEVFRDGRPLVIERFRVDGGESAQRAAWGLAGAPVTGTLVATPAGEAELERARTVITQTLGGSSDPLAAATLVDGALLCRVRATGAAAARTLFEAIWTVVRPGVLGRPPCPPRIWLT